MAAAMFGSVGEFNEDNEEWTQYEERLSHFFAANGIENASKKRSVFLAMVGPSAYKLLGNLVAPKKPGEVEYGELVKKLSEHHNPAPSEIVQRFKFNSRVRNPGESVAKFTAELRSLARFCNFKDSLDDMLRDRLVCGISDVQMQKRLLAEPKLTLKKATELALSMEAASKNAQALQPSGSIAKTHGENLHKVQSSTRTKPQKSPQSFTCYRCGNTGHAANVCKHKSTKCNFCGKMGHLQKVCRSKGRKDANQKGVHTVEAEEYEAYHIFSNEDNSSPRNPYSVQLSIDEKQVQMEIDTGASVSIISSATYNDTFQDKALQPSTVKLKTYSGKELRNLGAISVKVRHHSQEMDLPLLVVEGNGPSLLGRNWLEKLNIDWQSIHVIKTGGPEAEILCKEFSDVFKPGLGTLQGFKATIQVDKEASPVFCKARSVPYAMTPLVEKELDRLQQEGVIAPIAFSDWAAPIVPVLKGDKSVRICGDFKMTVNKVSKLDRYPIPKIEDLFAKLAGGKLFTKLDLSQAYQQICLEEESKKFVVINTHKGLFQFNRLPFGISSAPAIFQRTMESLLQGIPFVVVYLDDILVTGPTQEDHLQNLRKVLQRLQQAGLRLQRGKCKFMATSVQYLGHVIDAEGLHPLEDKVEAVQQAPAPENVSELRSYLGLLSYYSKFLPQLASTLAPLYALLHSGTPWKWTKSEEAAFQTSKTALLSSKVLVHFDPSQEIVLSCDASSYGIGAVLSHRQSDGSDRPIGFASRTLSAAEKKYSQLEKEGLACVFGVKRFHSYLYGHKFLLITDHKPLLGLLGESKTIPPQASARIQRWALTLAAYEYSMVFRSTGDHGDADAMSRLPLKQHPVSVPVPEEVVLLMQHLDDSPTDVASIRKETARHPLLSRVLQLVRHGWPNFSKEEELNPYYNRRTELSVQDGCLLWGSRVVVPPSLQSTVLAELHLGHPGVSRMKSLARMYVWWIGVDKDIEATVQHCVECQQSRPAPPAAPLHPWQWPGSPWVRLHMDFAGPFLGQYFLVIVDAHSKWLEVFPVASTSATLMIDKLRTLFAQFGIPQMVVTDNGSSFISQEFMSFLKKNGIRHITSAPYHPASNGLAERAVQTFKSGIKRMQVGSVQEKLSSFLFAYRNTPHSTTGVSPAELLTGRRLRCRLDLLKPDLQAKVGNQQLNQKIIHDRGVKERGFQAEDKVFVRNFRSGKQWLPAVVIRKTGPVSYLVRLVASQMIWRRHQDHVKRRYCQSEGSISEECPSWSDSIGSSPPIETSTGSTSSTRLPGFESRYPARVRQPPNRFVS